MVVADVVALDRRGCYADGDRLGGAICGQGLYRDQASPPLSCGEIPALSNEHAIALRF